MQAVSVERSYLLLVFEDHCDYKKCIQDLNNTLVTIFGHCDTILNEAFLQLDGWIELSKKYVIQSIHTAYQDNTQDK